MESDGFAKWDQFAILLQMEEWNKDVDRNPKFHDLPAFQAVAADRLGKQELQLDKNLLEEQRQQSDKPLREQQLRQDEELALAIVEIEQSLQTKQLRQDEELAWAIVEIEESLQTKQLRQDEELAWANVEIEQSLQTHQLRHDEELAWANVEIEQSLQTQQLRQDEELAWANVEIQQSLQTQQLRHDEELAWAIVEVEQSLQTALKFDEAADRDFNSHGLAEFQALAADRRGKQQRQIDAYLSAEQKQRWKNLMKEQQLLQDEELAWRLEAGSYSENEVYDLFFAESTDDRGHVGVGCVIKDSDGIVVFENRVCIGVHISHYFGEYNALINGLDVAQSIGLRRINAYGNRAFIYWEVEGQVEAPCKAEQELDALQNIVKELDNFSVNCVSRAENEDAIKLANYAAEHAPRLNQKSFEDIRQPCLICLENIFPSDIICQKSCCHRFCFDCLSQHVETEISGGKVPVRCPQFLDCAQNMHDNDCKRLVSPKLFDTYSTRLTEAIISDFDKVYCPFRGCSAMMCRTDENRSNKYAASSSTSSPGRRNIGSAECMECHRLFCVECHVPWHADLTCQQYQDLPPDERDAEDRKLFELAKDQKWRKCGKCRSLIILTEGCSHMTCRCGNEFCYTCGTNYRGKEKQCKCPLFGEAITQAPRRRWLF